MFGGYIGDSFKLHAMLFCSINDFPAYGNFVDICKLFGPPSAHHNKANINKEVIMSIK